MFRGRHNHVLDDKGRTSLPKDFRKTLEDSSAEPPFITLFPDHLAILPDSLFKKLELGLTDLGPISSMVEGIRRLLIGNAEQAPVDKQGRIMIPPHLRSEAQLERDIVLCGVGTYIEVWDRALFSRKLQETIANYAQWSEAVGQRLRPSS